jgi:hypothetical protein
MDQSILVLGVEHLDYVSKKTEKRVKGTVVRYILRDALEDGERNRGYQPIEQFTQLTEADLPYVPGIYQAEFSMKMFRGKAEAVLGAVGPGSEVDL